MLTVVFFFNDTATTKIYTEWIVGSVRCVSETAAALESLTEQPDLGESEAAFIKVAASYGSRNGISYGAWREVGVGASVLSQAGILRSS